MKNLHALLVGINEYHPDSNVPALAGCIADVHNFKKFLESNFPADKINMVVLENEEATYQNIIKNFGAEHLLKAKAGETIFIHYSGHGARAKSAAEFLPYFPEGKEETWVCYDSRTPGGFDLADKELAVLIDRLAQTGAEVVVSLDCCHSGSGTRAHSDIKMGKSRQWEDRSDNRPLDTYINGHFTQDNWVLPTSRHILLAACDKVEKALELTSHQGNFTANLLDVLNETKGEISYADLYTQCRIGMRKLTDQQNPQFETSGFFNAFDSFLGLGGSKNGASLKVFYEKGNWQINAGAINGLPTDGDKNATFEILEDDKPIGVAESNTVGVEKSTIQGMENLDENKIYGARMTSIPVPPIPVQLQTNEEGKKKIENGIATYQPIYFELIDSSINADYKLDVKDQQLRIWRNADDLLIRTITGTDEAQMFFDAFETLEKLCKWDKSLDLDNPKTQLNRDDVELRLVEMDGKRNVLRETSAPEILIDILIQEKVEQKVPFRIEAHNHHTTNQRYCALFYFSDNYGIYNMYNDTIPPKSHAIILDYQADGKPYAFELTGKNEALDIFKLLISNQKVSDYLLGQNPVDIGETVQYSRTRGDVGEAKSRGIGMPSKRKTEREDDWYTHTMKIKSVGQQAKVGEQSIQLADGAIKILGRKSGEGEKPFSASLSLSNAGNKTRSLDSSKIFLDVAKESNSALFNFGQNTRSASPSNILVLNDIENEDQLTTNPLQIEINTQLKESETILPFTFDGEHIIPIGESTTQADGKSLITIHHIPEIIEERKRSLTKALKLCFLKVILKRDNVQSLCWADFSSQKVVRRSEGLNTKIKDAKNILMVIHGIIGDTQVIADSMRQVYNEKVYDLVLTFDYENLNTPIQDTSAALKEKLKQAGISAESGRKITILAHSMGGLVSRYFIEQLEGNKVVKHLVMAGTPNAGASIAKFANYRDVAKTLLTLSMNSVWGIPAAATMLMVIEKSKKLTHTLEQMDGDKPFLLELNESPNPGIPYSIIAGHLDQFLAKNKDAKSLMDKLYDKGAKVLYGKFPNDIAVSVNSILNISKQWNLETEEVACHHLNYFLEEESMKVLNVLLAKGAEVEI